MDATTEESTPALHVGRPAQDALIPTCLATGPGEQSHAFGKKERRGSWMPQSMRQNCNIQRMTRHKNGQLCEGVVQRGAQSWCGFCAAMTRVQDGKGPQLHFEGVMADRRIGGTDRESYVCVSALSCTCP